MGRDHRILRFALLATALSLPVAGAAQAPPRTNEQVVPKGNRVDRNTCDENNATVGQGGVPAEKPDGRDLSERLAQSGGVICPPSSYVDPAIKAPTPPGGSMPVIPPPGSPGGDRSIQPK